MILQLKGILHNTRRERPFFISFTLLMIFFFQVCFVFGNPVDKDNFCDNLDGNTPEEIEAEAVRRLLQRLLPNRTDDFIIEVDFSLGPENKDTFKIENAMNNRIAITGNRGYTAASGLYHYLKYFCGCHVSWCGSQLQLPEILPRLTSPLKKTLNDRYRYYMNVCTLSYSTVWWDWKRWEKEIDWMALNGINLVLAFTGEEAIWKRVYKSINLTDTEIETFFTGPAFLAWNRMGNLQSWGCPLTDNWMSQQVQLQHHILQRMRSFGISPVYPAFNGHVPGSLIRLYPNASITISPRSWSHFEPSYGALAFLEPTDPLFARLGVAFIKEYANEFGSSHIYNSDLFNEMTAPSNETEYLVNCSKAVFETLTTADMNATWLIQGWMFYFNQEYWTYDRAKAYLTSVPIGRMIVLDLQAEIYPQYARLNSYFGQPFIWCMLHNYGGVLGLYGSLDAINKGPFEARRTASNSMIGTGITPEGIETNDVVYELMNEMSWRTEPVDLDEWICNYASRRYGAISLDMEEAWILLAHSVYNATAPYVNHGKYILTKRPSLRLKPYIWYNPLDVIDAWSVFVMSSKAAKFNSSALFRHDLVDLTRQSLQIFMDILYLKLENSYALKRKENLVNSLRAILELYDDVEEVLGSDVNFLLGRWLNMASSHARNPLELKNYGYNARNQITLWGPTGEIRDYANKQWSGLMSGYYRKRWEEFGKALIKSLDTSTPFNQQSFNEDVFDRVETPFTTSDETYPWEPTGDPVEICQKLFFKYIHNL